MEAKIIRLGPEEGSSGKLPTTADEEGRGARDNKNTTFESGPDPKPIGRRRRWADLQKKKEEGKVENLNELIFGPLHRPKTSVEPEHPGYGTTARWFDKCLDVNFDADEGVDDQLLGMSGWSEDHGEWVRVQGVVDSVRANQSLRPAWRQAILCDRMRPVAPARPTILPRATRCTIWDTRCSPR